MMIHNEARTRYSCRLCATKLQSKEGMQHHMINTHGAKDRKYPCSICGKTLATKQGYDLHQLAHSGKHRGKCNICGQFVTKSVLKKHMLQHKKRILKTCSRKKFFL